MVGHLLPDEAYEAVSAGAGGDRPRASVDRGRVAGGAARGAGAHLREAIATAHPDRLVYHRGRLVARDVFDDDVLRPAGRHRAFT